MRVVVDTNVIVNSLIARDSLPDRIMRAGRAGRFTLVLSSPLLGEIVTVLERPRLQRFLRVDPAAVREIVEGLRNEMLVPLPTEGQKPARNPEDEMVLATAVAAHVDYVVSGDKDLLVLREHEGIPIVSPREFLSILEGSRP